jgi:hypothetical protein
MVVENEDLAAKNENERTFNVQWKSWLEERTYNGVECTPFFFKP